MKLSIFKIVLLVIIGLAAVILGAAGGGWPYPLAGGILAVLIISCGGKKE